jgi:hypothetical protein
MVISEEDINSLPVTGISLNEGESTWRFAVRRRKKYTRGGTKKRVKATWGKDLAVMRLAPIKVLRRMMK